MSARARAASAPALRTRPSRLGGSGPHGASLPVPGEAAALLGARPCAHVLRPALHAPTPQKKTGSG